MIFDVLTLFPEMFEVFSHSIIKNGREKELIQLNLFNIRDFTRDKHKKVDDYPYGGGSGMVMQAEPIYNCINHITNKYGNKPYTILMSPRGEQFNQQAAKNLYSKGHIALVCGHYEGLDERIMDFIDCEISIGDFVLTGGEIASMAVIDTVARLVPGVLASSQSYEDESFYSGLLEYPQYTRPENFMGMKVPDVLLSGHHEKIRQWRRYQSLRITYERRPELLKNIELSKEDIKMLQRIKNQDNSSI